MYLIREIDIFSWTGVFFILQVYVLQYCWVNLFLYFSLTHSKRKGQYAGLQMLLSFPIWQIS